MDARAPQRLVLLGVIFLFGGESFCLLGPLRYERLVHYSCHAIFYAGAMLVSLGAILRWGGKRRR